MLLKSTLRICPTIGLATLFTLGAHTLNADTITTSDGSQIVGKVIGIEEGVIKIETSFAGVLEIAKDQATSINTDAPIFVEFSGGNTLLGTVSSSGPNSIQVTAPDGQFSSTIDRVNSSWLEGTDSPAERAHKAELEAKTRKWKYEISAELAGTSGNTDSLNTGLAFKGTLASSEDKLSLYGSYQYGETENSVSTDKSKAGARYERNFSERMFWYVRDELGRDNTQDLDLYNVAGAGLGYQFIKNDIQNLSMNAGIAYRYESYGSGTDVSVPAGDIGLHHDYLFSFGKVYTDIKFTPSFDDLADYRLDHETGIEIPVGASEMKIRAGVANNYHSQPVGGNDKLDNSYFTRIVWSWE